MAHARPLVLLGGGGLARETAACVRRLPGWRLAGVLDDDPALAGGEVAGLPVIGPLAAVHDLPGDVAAVLTTASGRDRDRRRRLARDLDLPDERWATVVDAGVDVPSSCSVGPGAVLLAGSVLTADVRIGAHVVAMPHCTLTHDDVVGTGSVLAAGVRLAGGVRVGAGCYLGSGALVREQVTIGEGCLLGMGSVLLRDMPAGQTWYGVPARPAPA